VATPCEVGKVGTDLWCFEGNAALLLYDESNKRF